MLITGKSFFAFSVRTKDGMLCRVRDIYFNENWEISSFVVRVGWPIVGRQILISPQMISHFELNNKQIVLNADSMDINSCSEPEVSNLISRRYDVSSNIYYGWPSYWDGNIGWGMGATPSDLTEIQSAQTADVVDLKSKNQDETLNLRSLRDLIGYDVGSQETMTGRFDDILIEEEKLNVIAVVVKMARWFNTRKTVLLPVEWVKDVDWREHEFYIDPTKELDKLPYFDISFAGNRDAAGYLYDYKGELRHWTEEKDSEHRGAS